MLSLLKSNALSAKKLLLSWLLGAAAIPLLEGDSKGKDLLTVALRPPTWGESKLKVFVADGDGSVPDKSKEVLFADGESNEKLVFVMVVEGCGVSNENC